MMTDWMMVVLTAVYVIATIFICFFNFRSAKATREQVAEMKRQFDEESRPYITTELIYEKRTYYGLRFTNHGKRIANHVHIHFEPNFFDSIVESSFSSALKTQNERECIIGIGQSYNLYFASNELRDNPNKVPLKGQLTYLDDKGKSYTDDFNIDLKRYATFFQMNSEMDDLLKIFQDQTKELKQMRDSLTRIANIINKEKNDE